MSASTTQRPLTPEELSVVARILNDYSGPGAAALLEQVDSGVLVRGPVTMLDVEVPEGLSRASIPDGPLAVRAIVESPTAEPLGELIIWIHDGFLSGLEYAWYTDEPPNSFPDPTHIRTSEQ